MITMALTAMGVAETQVIEEMRKALEEAYPVEIIAGPEIAPAAAALDNSRGQWSAPLLLKHVMNSTPAWAAKHVAVCDCDLFIPMLTFVYGQAQLGGQAAVVSLARLRQEFYRLPGNASLLNSRARKEAVHEAGHLFSLVHCQAEGCVMRLSTNVHQIDLKQDRLCPSCASQVLEQL